MPDCRAPDDAPDRIEKAQGELWRTTKPWTFSEADVEDLNRCENRSCPSFDMCVRTDPDEWLGPVIDFKPEPGDEACWDHVPHVRLAKGVRRG